LLFQLLLMPLWGWQVFKTCFSDPRRKVGFRLRTSAKWSCCSLLGEYTMMMIIRMMISSPIKQNSTVPMSQGLSPKRFAVIDFTLHAFARFLLCISLPCWYGIINNVILSLLSDVSFSKVMKEHICSQAPSMHKSDVWRDCFCSCFELHWVTSLFDLDFRWANSLSESTV